MKRRKLAGTGALPALAIVTWCLPAVAQGPPLLLPPLPKPAQANPSGSQSPQTPVASAKPQAPASASAPALVSANPNPAAQGQRVTFYWPADVVRVTVSGGGIKRPLDVSREVPFSLVGWHNATYTFDLWRKQASGELTHTRATVPVSIYSGVKLPPIATYRDPHGWRIDMKSGWYRYHTPLPDPKENALEYFEQGADSAERVDVAIMPVQTGTSSDSLMQQALVDAPTQYDVLKGVQKWDTTQCGAPATFAIFDGLDRALPDIALKEMVVAFVRNGVGYVISGRARKSGFEAESKYLAALVRSFAFETPAEVAQAERDAVIRAAKEAKEAKLAAEREAAAAKAESAGRAVATGMKAHAKDAKGAEASGQIEAASASSPKGTGLQLHQSRHSGPHRATRPSHGAAGATATGRS